MHSGDWCKIIFEKMIAMRTATAFDIFKELSGLIFSVPFILPNVTLYSLCNQMY